MNAHAKRRNPGPSWGYAFLDRLDRILPRTATRVLLRAGSLAALVAMGAQRRGSRRFLEASLDRPPTWIDSWKHFSAFADFLMLRFRAARGEKPRFQSRPGPEDPVEALAVSGDQALYGSFHYGHSDLMGFWLSRHGSSVRMARYRVENSRDLDWLERQFGNRIGFIWVNQAESMLLELKEAIEQGHSVAMKCDRIEHSSKLEPFRFLGARHLFPFTIYRLAILFNLPVAFAIGAPSDRDSSTLLTSTIYRPSLPDKEANLRLAREHFQSVLDILEGQIRQNPYLWFNFTQENPIAKDDPAARANASAPPR